MGRGASWAAVAVGGLVAVAVAACGSDPARPTPGAAGRGAQVFATSCAACHGADGGGGQGPALGPGTPAAALDRAQLEAVVRGGQGSMPAFGGRLADDDLAAVVDFVHDELGRSGASTTTAAQATGPGNRGDLRGMPPEVVDGDNWATANGDYLAQRARPDSPITSATVDRLQVAWDAEIDGGGTFGNLATTPLVVGDTVYVGDLTTRVHALDRATGAARFTAGEEASIFGPSGVAVGYGLVFGTTADATDRGAAVAAWDAATGERRWVTPIGANGSDVNVQPVVYDGLVYASTSGYGAGSRATVYALDAQTGAVVWDWVVIEDPDLWGHPELNSGGGVWYPPTVDVARGLVYVGTGNPYPFPGAPGFPNGSSRPGDNRWTDSMVALDARTGKLAWGHQAIAHDLFDRDAMLTTRVDVTVDGRAEALAISTGKLGVVYGLDADTGDERWRTEVGTHRNDDLTAIDGPTLVYPGSLGGVQTPLAVAEGTIYACVMNAPTRYEGPEETSYGFTVQLGTADSELVAIDAATGTVRWTTTLPGDALGGATVAGDLVFTSTFGGQVLALRRNDGAIVWRDQAPGGINGWPAVAGDQLFVPVGMADPPVLRAYALAGG